MHESPYTTLVSAATVAGHLTDPDWVVIDCRFRLDDPQEGFKAYQQRHIPSAAYADLDRHLSSPRRSGAGRHPMPDAHELAAFIGDQGAGNQTQIVAYDDAGGPFAARLWWLLRWLGHERVAVLDGGWQAWLKDGLPVDSAVRQRPAGKFIGRPDNQLWVDAEAVVKNLRTAEHLLLDARGAPRFRGEVEPIDPVAGHIPGAVNLPFQQNLDENGFFLDAETLRALYLAALSGYAPQKVICMCGSGVTACHDLLAMQQAGLSGARLYAGSWSEWICDPDRPVERTADGQ